jgi:hypothetical protein
LSERRPCELHPIEIEVGRGAFFDQFSFDKFNDLDTIIEIGKWQRP